MTKAANLSGLGTNTSTSGVLEILSGGTGQTTANAALNALLPSQTGNNGEYLTTDGTNTSWATVTQTTFSAGTTGFTPNSPTSGTVTLSGTLNVANGGTGVTTSTGSTSVVLSNTPTITNPTVTNYTESVVTVGTVGASATLSLTSGTVQIATLTSATACTFTMPTATAGKSFLLFLRQPAAGTPTTATFTGVKWNGAGAPVITATLGRADILSFIADGTSWYGSYVQGYTY